MVGGGRGRRGAAVVAVALTVVAAGCSGAGSGEAEHRIVDVSVGDGPAVRSVEEADAVRAFADDAGGVPARSVEPAAGGALVVSDRQAVSVSSEPLAVRWSYGRDTGLLDAMVTPDGEQAVLFFAEDASEPEEVEAVVLNVATGEVEDTRAVPFELLLRTDLADGLMLGLTTDGDLEARALVGGDPRWSFATEDGCGGGPAADGSVRVVGATAVALLDCGERFLMPGLDAASGEVLWEHAWDTEEAPLFLGLSAGTVAGTAQDPVRLIAEGGLGGTFAVLEADTGGETRLFWEGDEAVADRFPAPVPPEEADTVVVAGDGPGFRDRLTLAAAHVLLEEGALSADDLAARGLLVDGDRLPWSPEEWDADPSGKADAVYGLVADAL